MTTGYSYDGEDILGELRGSTPFKYVHGLGTDEPLGREDGSGALAYYHTDGLGSIVKRSSQTGTVVNEYRYDAWGNIELGARVLTARPARSPVLCRHSGVRAFLVVFPGRIRER